MSEDNTEIGGEAQEAPSPFKLIQHTKEDVALAFQNHGANTEEFLAVFTSRILNNMPSFRGKARYEDLISGKKSVVELNDETRMLILSDIIASMRKGR